MISFRVTDADPGWLMESFIWEDDQENVVGSMFPISGPGLV
jgi:hypothetical protein